MNAPANPVPGLALTTAREWCIATGAALACLAVLCAVFSQEVVGAVRVWIDSETYNHCFLVIPIALYLIWQRREILATLVPRPDYRALPLILGLSVLWFGVSVLGILEAQQFVVMTMMQAILFGVFGMPVYRALLGPFLYLYFLVPSGEFLVPSLQDFTARFAVLGLQLVGIPVYSDGTLIEVPAGTFSVEEACAGLRFLIASLAFGVFYAMEIYQSRLRRGIFIGLSIVVPIIANGFRAFGLIAAAEAFGSASAVEADHITYGWVFFSIVLIALIFIGRSFSDRGSAPIAVVPDPAAFTASKPRLKHYAATGGALLALAIVGPAVAIALDGPRASRPLSETAPVLDGRWTPLGDMADWHPEVVKADREISTTYSDGTIQVDGYVALYALHGRTSDLIRSDNRIANAGWGYSTRGQATAQIEGKAVSVNATQIISGNRRRLIWWFYVVDGEPVAPLWNVKLLQAKAYVSASTCPSALVAASVDMSASTDPAAVLQSYYSSMSPLRDYLCRVPAG
jgi:exosortase A